jgi:hypothetical protein
MRLVISRRDLFCPLANFPGQSASQVEEESLDRRHAGCTGSGWAGRPHDHNDVETGWQPFPQPAKDIPQPPLPTVADNCMPHPAGDRQAQPGNSAVRPSQPVEHQRPGSHRGSTFVDRLKIERSPQAGRPRKPAVPAVRVHQTSPVRGGSVTVASAARAASSRAAVAVASAPAGSAI